MRDMLGSFAQFGFNPHPSQDGNSARVTAISSSCMFQSTSQPGWQQPQAAKSHSPDNVSIHIPARMATSVSSSVRTESLFQSTSQPGWQRSRTSLTETLMSFQSTSQPGWQPKHFREVPVLHGVSIHIPARMAT